MLIDLEFDDAILNQLQTKDNRILAIRTDVSNGEQVGISFDKMHEEFGTPDILINNAAIYPTQDFLKMTEENWLNVFDVDVKSVFLCTQAVVKSMIESELKGSIVNIGSIDAFNPSPGHAHYSSAKAAVHSLTLYLASEFGKYGIRANTVSPGLINRPNLEATWPEGYSRYKNKAPLRKIPEPMDIANACLFLSSDLASSISGANLYVDCGIGTCALY
jgi:3-oxoacyl-[acyl-carrier protein] reductase